jgi:o-succinylbenzoate synthase
MEVEPYSLPLVSALETAHGSIEQREGFLVTVSGDGAVGVGEAAPLPGFTESAAACQRALETAAAVAKAEGVSAAHDALDPAETPAAAHAVSLAALDASATLVGEPLFRSLGGQPRERVPVNATIGDAGPAETARAATAAVEQGFDCLKVKVGARSLSADVARLEATRDAVGPAVCLRADANEAWSREGARDAVDALAATDVDLAYLEQPLPRDDLAGLAALRDDVPIAVDETLCAHDLPAVLEADAADVVVVKPMVHGSPVAARDLALRAADAGLAPVVTTTVDAVVARTAAVHLAASLPEPRPAGLATASLLETDLAPDPAPVTDGAVAVPQGPGLGVDWGAV